MSFLHRHIPKLQKTVINRKHGLLWKYQNIQAPSHSKVVVGSTTKSFTFT